MNKENKRVDEWVPTYEYRKILFKECALENLSIYLEKDYELWRNLKVGTKLALVREKDNKYDINAVALALGEDYDGKPVNLDFVFVLGYIPQTDNVEIARMMDAGYSDKFSAEITTLRPFAHYSERIRISIFIESKEPELIRPHLMRAQTLDLEELRDMVDDLEERGWYFFYMGYDKLQYPIKGENIVIINHGPTYATLYLMKIIAAGYIECASFLNNHTSLDHSDGCIPLIITNVMGPIREDYENLEFLNRIHGSFFAMYYLPPSISECFESLFSSERE